MLPEDTQERKDAEAGKNAKLVQTTVSGAFKDSPPAVKYSDAGFLQKLIRWAVCTDQVSCKT